MLWIMSEVKASSEAISWLTGWALRYAAAIVTKFTCGAFLIAVSAVIDIGHCIDAQAAAIAFVVWTFAFAASADKA
jgi:hypothetical protein